MFLKKSIKRKSGILLSYLFNEIPPERYALFLRGNLLVFAGYSIVTLETFIAIYYGLTNLTYERTFYISFSILTLTAALTAVSYFKKKHLIWHELIIFGIYVITYLVAFCLWIFWLGDLRFLGILNGITAVTIVLSYTSAVQSLFMSMPTLICYYSVTWYSIKIAGQPGSLIKETFLSICLVPAFILISLAAYYMNKKRKDLQNAKNELEKLNDDLSDANDKLKKEQQLTEIEMELANEIQSAIFPSKTPVTTDWDIAFLSKSYGAVSGDFYDFYSGNGTLEGLSLFDVSGHGVAPALITILAKPLLYHQFKLHESLRLGRVLESVNTELLDQLEDVNLYITGLVLRMDGSNVEYVNAGHPDLLHLKTSEKKVRVITDPSNSFKGPPVGISLASQKYLSLKFTVPAGDFLIFYSDGLTDSKNNLDEQYGISRLVETITSFDGTGAAELLRHIAGSLENFTGDIKAGDDVTIIVAGRI